MSLGDTNDENGTGLMKRVQSEPCLRVDRYV